MTYSQNRRASSIISSLGEQRDVLVAARDLERGETVARGDFSIEQRPVGFVPLDALKRSDGSGETSGLELAEGLPEAGAQWNWDPGQVALEPIYAGEILVSERVGTGADLRIPLGTSAIAVPIGESQLSLSRGDRVDLLGSFLDGPAGEVSVLIVAQNAFVVETADRTATVAVQPSELSGVVRSLTHGVATVVLRG